MAAVGRIARAHGLRGQVILDPDTDFPDERFQPGAELFIERSGVSQGLTIETVRFHRGRPIVGFAGLESMNDAEALAGLEVRVPRETLAALPAGVFYRHDLVGCAVETRAGEKVGVVTGVEGTLGGSRLVVRGARGEAMIPLAAEICVAIDPAAKRIVIAPPEGLLDLNA
jgi:16S rRNA processing protein RimM